MHLIKKKDSTEASSSIQITRANIFTPHKQLVHAVFSPKDAKQPTSLFQKTELETTISRCAKKLGFKKILLPAMSHSSKIEIFNSTEIYEIKADGLITQQPNIAIAITHSDCQCAVIMDPRKNLIAAVHAGWRGLFGGIYQNTIEKCVALGSRPEDLLVYISPSLGEEHSEFIHYETEIPKSYHLQKIAPCHFDLKEIAHQQFVQLGIQETQIEISPICTFKSPSFYSYRRHRKKPNEPYGLNFTLVGIQSRLES
ncbi:MAG: peptidoglycan editing factor PgeF [Chlamydiia bacterium]